MRVLHAIASTLILAAASAAHADGGASRAPDPVAPAVARMSLGSTVRTALPGCDNPTPVRGPGGAVYSNVSDCSVGGGGKVSSGWVRLRPGVRWVPSDLTTRGEGASGRKLSGALVEGGTLYLLERNSTRSGGMRLGRSADVARPRRVAWTASLDFGWGSFAQAAPGRYAYVYLRDARTAYGRADRVDLARAPRGRIADLAAWEVFAGTPARPAWVPWARRADRRPVLADRGRIGRPHVSHLGGCWVMAVTMPAPGEGKGGDGLAVYTSREPYGPWDRRYYVAGRDHGESAQFSPLWPGQVLLTRGDRLEWRRYSLPGGC